MKKRMEWAGEHSDIYNCVDHVGDGRSTARLRPQPTRFNDDVPAGIAAGLGPVQAAHIGLLLLCHVQRPSVALICLSGLGLHARRHMLS